ncbi:MAG: hypothetical protein GQ552_01725, partial [Flavobacteriaceae bacterium]|nr:hypothetical protein [Flavobacteriaceae bacterium]
RVDIEREIAKQSLLNYENTVLNALLEVDNSLVSLSTLREKLTTNELILKTASNASYLSRERYYQGVTEDELNKYTLQLAEEENIDVNTIDRDSLVYQGQIVNLHLTPEEKQARKEETKAQRKLEREQRKQDKKSK